MPTFSRLGVTETGTLAIQQFGIKAFESVFVAPPAVARDAIAFIQTVAYNESTWANVSFTGGDNPFFAIVSVDAVHGTAVASGTGILYTPVSGYHGGDSFTYAASNAAGQGATAVASLTVRDPSPVRPVPDPSLLLHFDGDVTNAGYAHSVDAGTSVWTFDMSNKQVGTGAGYAPTVPKTVFAPPQAELSYFAGSFSMELWAWFNIKTANREFMGAYAGDAFNDNWKWSGADGGMYFTWVDSAVGVQSLGTASITNAMSTWHHYAVDYDGTTMRMYFDGSMTIARSVGLLNMKTSARTFAWGHVASGGATTPDFAGLVDEVRIVSSVALWQGNGFTPPTTPHPAGFTVASYNTAVTVFHTPEFFGGVNPSVLHVASSGIGGTAVVSGNAIAYLPDSGFFGVDTIGYYGTNPSGDGPVGSHIFVIPAPPLPTPLSSVTLLMHMKNGDTSDATGVHTMHNPNNSLTAASSGVFFANTPSGFQSDTNYIFQTSPGPGVTWFDGEYTVEMKLRFDNAAPMPRTRLLNTISAYNFSLTTSGSLIQWTFVESSAGGGLSNTYAASYAVNSTDWIDFAVSFDGVNHRLFVNGDMLTKSSSVFNNHVMIHQVSTANIGGDWRDTFSTFRGFHGEMAELRYTAKALYDDAGYTPVDYHYNDASFLVGYNSNRWVQPDFLVAVPATSITGSGAHGTVTTSADWLNFAPASGFYGVATVAFEGHGVNGQGPTGYLVFDVEAPVVITANSVEQIVLANTGTWISLSFDSAPSSVEVGTAPTHGTAVASGTGILYTPTALYLGDDSFTYAAWGQVLGPVATATIHVSTVLPASGDKQRLFPGPHGNRMFPLNDGRQFPHT